MSRLKFILENKTTMELTIKNKKHAAVWLSNQQLDGVYPCCGINCDDCELNGNVCKHKFGLADIVKIEGVIS